MPSMPGQHAVDLGDQGGVGGAVPGPALEQARCGNQQEGQHQTVRLGQVQRALQGTVGGVELAERIPGNRLQHVRQRQPVWPDKRSRARHDRGERGGRGARVVEGEPQRRLGDAALGALAVGVAQPGQQLPGGPGLAEGTMASR
jgi:hypothetical protein